jgi:AraC family transcriptional regulator
MSAPDRRLVFESVHREGMLLKHHGHETAFATIVLEGAYTEVCNAIPSVCPVGTIVLHGEGEEHADYFTNAGRCLNVELERPARSVLASSAIDAPLRRAVDDVVRAFYTRPSEMSLDETVANLQNMLNVGSSEPPVASERGWLEAVIDGFEWTGNAPLREAAALAGIHPTHFSREFHRRTGETPNDYRRRARVGRASELLLSTSRHIADIALACGFNDQSHLTRAFGASLALTPGEYRRTFAR